MRTIVKIEGVESKTNKDGETYWKTHAILDDGSEAVGYGKDFDLEDKVEYFYDEKWGVAKMRKSLTKE